MSRLIITVFIAAIMLIATPGVYAQKKPFIYFSVEPASTGAVMLTWKVMPAADTLPFEVEKSIDEKNWKKISTMESVTGHEYFFTDTRSETGIVYYRVRQLDINSPFTYSPSGWIQFNTIGKLFVWPNPARDLLHVKTPFTNGNIIVMDEAGRSRFKVNITDFTSNVPIANLSKGIYFIQIRHGREVYLERFVKQ